MVSNLRHHFLLLNKFVNSFKNKKEVLTCENGTESDDDGNVENGTSYNSSCCHVIISRREKGKSRKKESEKSGLGQIMDWYLTVISVPFNAAFMTIPDATLSHRHLISAILVSLFWIAGLTYVNNKVPYSLSFSCLILPLCFQTVHGRLDNKNWLHFGN